MADTTSVTVAPEAAEAELPGQALQVLVPPEPMVAPHPQTAWVVPMVRPVAVALLEEPSAELLLVIPAVTAEKTMLAAEMELPVDLTELPEQMVVAVPEVATANPTAQKHVTVELAALALTGTQLTALAAAEVAAATTTPALTKVVKALMVDSLAAVAAEDLQTLSWVAMALPA
jgi:hypothetical protein